MKGFLASAYILFFNKRRWRSKGLTKEVKRILTEAGFQPVFAGG